MVTHKLTNDENTKLVAHLKWHRVNLADMIKMAKNQGNDMQAEYIKAERDDLKYLINVIVKGKKDA